MSNFTQKAIKETFLKLLEEKPLNQITVKMIVEECGINRNSFYYHYRDLPDLIEEIVMENADRIIKEYASIDSIEIALNAAVDFASQNRRAVLHIYHSVNRDIFERYLWKVCYHAVARCGETVLRDKPIKPEDKKLIDEFYCCECFGVAIHWMNENMPDDIHAKITRFCKLHHGMTEEMIRRSAEE